jgi:hypothetical protein
VHLRLNFSEKGRKDPKAGFSIEEIRVTSGSHKTQLTTFDSIDQQPIGFNMTLPAVL